MAVTDPVRPLLGSTSALEQSAHRTSRCRGVWQRPSQHSLQVCIHIEYHRAGRYITCFTKCHHQLGTSSTSALPYMPQKRAG
jgi:hypothetical protein